jgi:hypothetical protein
MELTVIDYYNGHNSPYIMYFRMDNDKTILDLKTEINELNINIIDKTFIDYHLKVNDLTITSDNDNWTLYEAGIVNGSEIILDFHTFS